MSDSIKIELISGQIQGGETSWTFDEPGDITIGRMSNMQFIVPSSSDYMTVSRTNTKISIRPPRVYVSDFGSRGGTFLDGELIGKRPDNMEAEEGRKQLYPMVEAKNGSIIGMGAGNGSVIRFRIELPEPKAVSAEAIKQKVEEEGKKQKAAVAQNQDPGATRDDDFTPAAIKTKRNTPAGVIAMESQPIVLKKLERIGKGGFGGVYKAVDMKTGNYYAVKEMISEVEVSEIGIAYFMRERNLATQLSHEHIVKTYENQFTIEEKKNTIIMEYCGGGNLAELLKFYNGKINETAATDIMLDLLAALDYAHNASVQAVDKNGNVRITHGLVHRDVKPANILFTEEGVIKLSDFGLAKAFNMAGQSGLSVAGSWAGSYLYCPRKQINNFCYTRPDADVFAAAAIYFQMLTGRFIRPFTAQDALAPELAIIGKPILKVRDVNPNISREIADLIDAVLAEDEKEGSSCMSAAKFSYLIRKATGRI